MPRRKPIDPERSADLPVHRIGRILQRLEERVFYDHKPLEGWEHRRALYHAPGEYECLDSQWQPFRVGESWGGDGVTSFLRTQFSLPPEWRWEDSVLLLDMDGGESLLSLNGRKWQGLDWNRRVVSLAGFSAGEERVLLEIEAYVINYPYDARRNDQRSVHTFARADLARVDRRTEAYVRDLSLALEAYRSFWQEDRERELEEYLLYALSRSTAILGPPTAVSRVGGEKIEEAHALLRELTFDSGLFKSPGRITVTAHSHLDIVYLWPLKETLRKNIRSVANALSLMREYPEYRFSWSQPWLYEKLKELAPDLFAEVAERVREGRWEPVGAMLVEPDGNLPGGESMIRQIALGQRFYREEFGRESRVCWLPDVFGAMYTLPQILKKSGIDYFSTAKLAIWNDTNDFPYGFFKWRGPDGSEILTHFPPTHFAQDYTLANLRSHWSSFSQRYALGETMFVYGPADGGGGPTREMAAGSIATREFPGLPEVRLESAEDFFERNAPKGDQMPVWEDELYLEAHRGTYTSRASLKRWNRRLEGMIRNGEVINALARLHGGPSGRGLIDQGWRKLLLNQFHDILPGTHVPEAHEQIEEYYAGAEAAVRDALEQAKRFIADATSLREGEGVLVFNTLSWSRDDLLPIPRAMVPEGKVPADGKGEPLEAQGEGDTLYLRLADTPPVGWRTLRFVDQPDHRHPVGAAEGGEQSWFEWDRDGGGVSTPAYQIRWDESGDIVSLFDRLEERELFAGKGNQFLLFDDDPGRKFNAWDLAYHIHEHIYQVETEGNWSVAASGPLFIVATIERRVLDSVITQEMWLYRFQRRIDFRTRVRWRNSEKTLKVRFPFALRGATGSTHLPFGAIRRPTHRNTSWEQAKYEVLMHYWADLSEAGFGCAVLNDSKYGCSFLHNTVEITLLRGPVHPDPNSDLGEHEFCYALYPHRGSRENAVVHREAYQFNIPWEIHPGSPQGRGELPQESGLFSSLPPEIVVENLKEADEVPGVVARLYEATGKRSRASVDPPRGCTGVEVDLLERRITGDGSPDAFELNPYEIRSFLFTRAGEKGEE
ncbi:MAG: alpha-mannosidase [Alkalispirochaetaceae bacterium]